MILKQFAIAVALAALSPCLAADPNGQQYSDIYVFGDSLSDVGNMNLIDPRAPKRFTNGRVAVEVMAEILGFPPLTPSLHLSPTSGAPAPPGKNYAVAGARAADEDGEEATPDINLPTQVNAFLRGAGGGGGASAPPAALYAIGIGGNDVRNAQQLRASAVLAPTQQERKASIDAARSLLRGALTSQIAQIEKLVSAGARNIVVIGCPDVGASPEVHIAVRQISAAVAHDNRLVNAAGRLPRKASRLSEKYNRALRRKLRRLERRNSGDGVNIIFFDTVAFMDTLIENALDHGFTNTDDACIYIFSQGGTVNPECADYPLASGFFFWDELHPTAATHELFGQALADAVSSST